MHSSLAVAVLALLAAGAPAGAERSASVVLSPSLAEWRDEIEGAGRGVVVVARVYTDPARALVHLPKDAGGRPALLGYFRNEAFLKELLAAHALSLTYSGDEGKYLFVLLNMGRAAEWGAHEEAVIAHEFGHLWLSSRNYPSPLFRGEPDACLAILANGVAQHALIRAELARRGFDHLGYWLPILERTLDDLDAGAGLPEAETPVCPLMSQLALWLDVHLGLDADRWSRYQEFQAAMEKRYPALKRQYDELCRMLDSADFGDERGYQRALEDLLHTFYGYRNTILGPARPLR